MARLLSIYRGIIIVLDKYVNCLYSVIMRSEALKRAQRKYQKYYQSTPKGRWYKFKAICKHYGKSVSITREEFISFIGNPCYYCDNPIPATSGCALDRLDSSKGYEIGNLVTCCLYCNQIKGNKLTEHETIQVIKLLKYLRNGKLY